MDQIKTSSKEESITIIKDLLKIPLEIRYKNVKIDSADEVDLDDFFGHTVGLEHIFGGTRTGLKRMLSFHPIVAFKMIIHNKKHRFNKYADDSVVCDCDGLIPYWFFIKYAGDNEELYSCYINKIELGG